ncbi:MULTISPECIES: Invasion protein B family [Pseudomonas]|uniref:InvB/SpaK family type III secretion system chaperone n=1 Tax=Pseudomonas TaxID=286 RepID=UPI001BE75B82|nr:MULTISPECIES: Invasion protein B family [Pseudomonas]MBT2339715.1 Invasion protein B family [Pseudomonas fluorescens]MCD4531237.1 Invasion protein B family [Pseudomonas sp. C3-2018]
MLPMDIASLLRESLRHSGCLDSQIGHFDSHSTIEMKMKNLPDINVAVVGDDVWIWAMVGDAGPSAINHCAFDLMQFLLGGNPFSRTGQLHLCDVEGRLELRLMASAYALGDAEHFAQALDSFVHAIECLLEIFRQ